MKAELIRRAQEAGFVSARITAPHSIPEAAARLTQFLALDRQGDMTWLAGTAERRQSPLVLWPEVRSVVMLAMSYAPEASPLEALSERMRGVVAAYAKGRDYHDLVKGRLKTIAAWLARATGAEVKVFVDTAPVMEKPLAEAAGVGWQGKHTNLVSRQHGSWLLLGAIFSAADLPPDEAEDDYCGSCRRCLDICPTNAFPAPYQLDPRRCIAYLTIEHAGPIPEEFRRPIGNRIFGCDDCLAVCPWNKFAKTAQETRLHARLDTDNPPLDELLSLDDAAFRQRFRGTPVKRTGRDRFLRNVLIAAGNSGERAFIAKIEIHLSDASPLVRGAAVWALSQLTTGDAFAARKARHVSAEPEQSVRDEWQRGAAP